MGDQTFLSLTLGDIASLTNGARRRIVYGAPGVDQGLAVALVNASERLGRHCVTILLDVAEDNCRVGYGESEGYSILVERGAAVRLCPGLRIGFLLFDDDGYIFAMPPLMVEDIANQHTAPNAIRASPDQILRLLTAIKPEFKAPMDGDKPDGNSATSRPEIGTEVVPPTLVSDIADRIKSNPVQDFDLTRIVRVFSAHMQFVEFKVEGAKLKSRTIALPREMLSSIRDKHTRARMKTTFKLGTIEGRTRASVLAAIEQRATQESLGAYCWAETDDGRGQGLSRSRNRSRTANH